MRDLGLGGKVEEPCGQERVSEKLSGQSQYLPGTDRWEMPEWQRGHQSTVTLVQEVTSLNQEEAQVG